VEQRKVLLIIVSVTIVLAAIIGVGIWLFYPRDGAQSDLVADAGGGLEWEPLDYLRGDGIVPDPDEEEPAEGDFVVTYGVADDPSVGPAASDTFVSEQPDPSLAAGGEPERAPERTAAVPSDERATSTAAPGSQPETSTAERAAPVASARPAAADAPPASTPQPDSTTGRPAASPELADRAYWVQAISSPNRDTIEQAQRTLREHKLGTRILTKEIGGTTYFRLRLGPFAVREEAEKFLGWVTEIDGFADAMIFVDYTTIVLAAQRR
jgi:cell division septation protein DedD